MRVDARLILTCVLGAVCLLVPAASVSVAQAPPAPRESLDALFDELGAEDYAVREAATRRLFSHGPSITPQLQARLDWETDPEIQHRLRYLLRNIVPPARAVLLIRADPDSGLEPGTVITHAGAARVESQSELRRILGRPPHRMALRTHDKTGPRVVGPVDTRQLVELSDYTAPRGETLAGAVRLYAAGFAERAYEMLLELGGQIPENELSRPLRARIAYTAGHGARALELMEDHAPSVRATAADWTSPSFFDLFGPGKAPYHLEWVLASVTGRESFSSQNDPDLRIQRILLPAQRFADALTHSIGYWERSYRNALGKVEGADSIAGNQLAVSAWMLHGLDLRSECCRLIEPRSVILRHTASGLNKWIRVETDAWLPFLAGDARAALDGFHDDAFDVLQRPPRPGGRHALIRKPRIAARVACFLYQFPNDPRVGRTFEVVNQHQHPALPYYLDSMLYALRRGAFEAIRRDLHAALPRLDGADVRRYARAAALLEYARAKPSADVIRAVRAMIVTAPRDEDTDLSLAIVDTLLRLLENRPEEALRTLQLFEHQRQVAALRHTAEFRLDPPDSAANHAALKNPILAVPMGTRSRFWLVLARDRRLLCFDAENSLLTACEPPTPTWFPSPLAWPWIGREEATGRVWVYGRRRVIEMIEAGKPGPFRMNIRTADIAAFDELVSPHFTAFADAASAVEHAPAEDGEFLRSELKANLEYVADPDLPELGHIQSVPGAGRIVHLALRGGPHMLIDRETGRSWTSVWIARRLGLPTPPTFFVQAFGSNESGDSPLLLLSDQGLIRFGLATEALTRVPLPGPNPHPPLIPESTPYERRDPRWVYCARLPEDGGAVYRIAVEDWSVARVDMVNEALPEHYYSIQRRSEIRAALDRALVDAALPALEDFIAGAAETVANWRKQSDAKP